MAEASFSGTLRIIIILILIFYAFKFLFRIFAPIIFQQLVKKAGESFHARQGRQYENSQQPNTNMVDKPKEKQKVGEYIDYEEIE